MADFDDDGVEVNDGVEGIEIAVLPGFDLLDDGVGGVCNEGARDLYLVDFKEVLLDLAHAQASRIEAHNALVEAVELALMLGHECGFKVAVTVARNLDCDLAVVATQCLGAVTITGVGRVCGGAVGRTLMFVVAEVGGELGIKDTVDKPLFQFGEQAFRSEQVARLAVVFEQLVEEFVCYFWFH